MKVFPRLATCSLYLAAGTALAGTNIAIIDSGVDYKHKDLTPYMWHDQASDSEYPDDVNGWNVAEDNAEVIDYSYLGTFSPDCMKFFTLQGKVLLGTATADETQWYKTKRADETFVKSLETFGNFVHGTHVTGIATAGNADARAIPVKMIPTKRPGTFAPRVDLMDGSNDSTIQFYLGIAASQNLSLVTKTSTYANKKGARVANCSFGASAAALAPTITMLLKQITGADPTPADVRRWSLYLLDQLNKGSKQFTGAAPNTLFVIAAGNDGTNNDTDPAWPANAKEDNTISVAATKGTSALASFSNYGAQMVDVAAPGVVIMSTIPGDEHMELSGTSMAAPFVTDAAGQIAAANSALTPAQIKQTLIGTVDKKDFLTGKVSSGGIVNKQRAVYAAELASKMPLAAAIEASKARVSDLLGEDLARLDDALIVPVPLPNPVH